MPTISLLEEIKKLQSIADIGLLYCTTEYDKERYAELKEISLRLLSVESNEHLEHLRKNFPVPPDYPTAKIDIRGLILSPDKKILLVKEMADGQWSLPGGWADVGYTPSEAIIKEVKEETGLEVKVDRLLAVFDKRKHNHPPQFEYVYKLVFYCTAVPGELSKGFDVLDVQYFALDDLPQLSENRILKSQIEFVYQKVLTGDTQTFFD